jgi:hypothetical protein
VRWRIAAVAVSAAVVGLGLAWPAPEPSAPGSGPGGLVLAAAPLSGSGTAAGEAAPLFDLEAMTPGRRYERCVVISAGTAAPAVTFGVDGVRGPLAPWLRLDVTTGTGSSASCDDFTADGRSFYTGTLAALAAGGTAGVDTGWAPRAAERRTFRIVVDVADDARAANVQAVADLVWSLSTAPPATPAASPSRTSPAVPPSPAARPSRTPSSAQRSHSAEPSPVPAPAPAAGPGTTAHGTPPVTRRVLDLLKGVARNAGFPLLLLVLVGFFLLLQNRLDRRDPKLAQAPLYGDPDQPFPTDGTTPWRIP